MIGHSERKREREREQIDRYKPGISRDKTMMDKFMYISKHESFKQTHKIAFFLKTLGTSVIYNPLSPPSSPGQKQSE